MTGRVGYNNTPVVVRRDRDRESYSPAERQRQQQQQQQYNSSRGLTRSTSAYDYYGRHERGPEPETGYLGRSKMMDLIHSDDEIITRRYHDNDVIQLPNGARYEGNSGLDAEY